MALFAVRPRMCTVISAGQMLKIKVGVNLRGCNTGVPQQFLYGAQVAAGLQHVGGEGVAQQVRVYASIQSAALAPPGHPCLNGAAREPGTATAHEYGCLAGRG